MCPEYERLRNEENGAWVAWRSLKNQDAQKTD